MEKVLRAGLMGMVLALGTAGCTSGTGDPTASSTGGSATVLPPASAEQAPPPAAEPTLPVDGPRLPVGGPSTPVGEPAPPAGGPALTAGDAEAIALGAVGGGEVVRMEVDDVDDVLQVWEVALVTTSGERRDVTIDRTTGRVLGNELDD
ncbi:PepSY domain-containing protein [Geodermatophilus sp. YIM 151500]|uniref:PepSY domain-containing protein n=1 Tax=Geodermatophilus sp. YIM 151500 TaxID=2984531 RepID=UPI0021E47E08|nr:PepSY domain-containing protein [Geodermatophilus sp. YIM 151500]MCV2491794.1 PepSY domain-containing protein [Geodermatophilus sp. YIM 151500]